MRRFKFRLETVLQHRITLETLREQEFAVAQGHLEAMEIKIGELRAEFRATVGARPGSQVGERLNAAEVLDRERYLETLLAALTQWERKADVARVQAEQTRLALVEARQAREVVSRLRDREYLEHTALNIKTEQDTLDEAATLRFARAGRIGALSMSKVDKEAA